MKRIIKQISFGIFLAISLAPMQACQRGQYSDIKFANRIDRKIFLSECGRKILASKGREKEKYFKMYFRAFPSDFGTFFSMVNNHFYVDSVYIIKDSGWYASPHNPWGKFYPAYKFVESRKEIPQEHLSANSKQYMDNLKLNRFSDIDLHLIEILWGTDDNKLELRKIIPESIYYEKMIGLGIGGFWDADDIGYIQMHLRLLLCYNMPLTISILEKKTDEEIASFCFFLYDGPHPRNYQEEYNYRYKEISKLSPRVANLMKKAYERLLSEEHCEGH